MFYLPEPAQIHAQYNPPSKTAYCICMLRPSQSDATNYHSTRSCKYQCLATRGQIISIIVWVSVTLSKVALAYVFACRILKKKKSNHIFLSLLMRLSALQSCRGLEEPHMRLQHLQSALIKAPTGASTIWGNCLNFLCRHQAPHQMGYIIQAHEIYK